MLYVACILLGIIAARWLYRPLAALLRALAFIVSIAVAFRVTALVAPLQIEWRGFWSSAALGLLFALTIGGAWFYMLGWRGRVAATELEEIERIRQKAQRDRTVVMNSHDESDPVLADHFEEPVVVGLAVLNVDRARDKEPIVPSIPAAPLTGGRAAV